MATSLGRGDPGAIEDINTTPLIDVMLVLLIMFVITLPAPTHGIKVDLPGACQSAPCPPPPVPDPVKNVIYVAPNDAILWNDRPVALTQLRQVLESTQAMVPIPELHLQPDAMARQETVSKVLKETKLAQVTKMGFVGNEAYLGAF